MANIKDVARKAGVSISTVSYAINGSPKVSAGTRARILKIAKDLHYSPSGLAKNLKSKRTNIIGVFMDGVVGPYYGSLVLGVQEMIKASGYGVIVTIIDKAEKNYGYNLLMERWVDGAVILNAAMISRDFLKNMGRQMPLVLVDIEPEFAKELSPQEKIVLVELDSAGGVRQAVQHLAGLGYKKIGYLAGLEKSFDNKIRYTAFREALAEAGLSFDDRWYYQGGYRNHFAYESLKAVLPDANLPEALFCANDEMAMGALRAFEEFNVRVPEDIAIVGFDNIDYTPLLKPSLTTISYDRYRIGEQAVKRIFEMLEGKFSPEPIRIETTLVVRESSGAKLKRA